MKTNKIPKLTIMQKNNFWSKVIKSDNCWEWNGSRLPKGYGMVRVNGILYYAHRVSYQLAGGRLEHGKDVCHSCNNPSCVNPEHLRVDTRKGNFKDKEAAGTNLKGSKVSKSVLNEDQVRNIRLLYKVGHTQLEISNRYNVNPSTIGYIVRNNTWRHI